MSDSILDKIMQSKKEHSIQKFQPVEIMKVLLKQLGDRERRILQRRFGLFFKDFEYKKETLEKIGKDLGITRERVRQIQNDAISKLKKLKKKGQQELFKVIEDVIDQLLENYGYIMEENFLIDKMIEVCSLDIKNCKQFLLFIIDNLLDEKIEKIPASEEIKQSWKKPFFSVDFLLEFLSEVEKLIKKESEVMDKDTLLDRFSHTEFYKTHHHRLSEDTMMSYLHTSTKVSKNIFGEWGLSYWKSITPKSMNDKIYLIFKKHAKPLHFREVTEKINEAQFDHKIAYPATIHNELILDDKYVLVGRGIYALKDWGYKKGTVAEVLEEIMREKNRPLTKEEIIEEILKRRIVKRSTIQLALMNKKKIGRLDDGRYILLQNK